MYKNPILIYNGKAGNKDIERTLDVVVPILTSRYPNLKMVGTQKPNHAREICSTYGESVDLVICLGGDGTVHECINGLSKLDRRPIIGILPGGTCNDFSRSLMIEQDIRLATEQIISSESVPVDVLRAGSQYGLNFWGAGLVAETSMNIQQAEKEQFGKLSYLLSAVRTVKDAKHFKYQINIDGKEMEGEAVLILIANGNYIGTNFLPFKSIKYNDGVADVFVVKNTNIRLLKELLTKDITIDRNKQSEEIKHYTGKSISVLTEEKMPVDMDGELYAQTPSHIEVLKHHLHIIKPS